MSDARDAILRRIREALARPTAREAGAVDLGPDAFRRHLPPAGADHDDRVRLFAENARALRAEFETCRGLAALTERLREIARTEGWTRIATHRGTLTDAAGCTLDLPTLRTDAGYDPFDLASCDVGLTECEALVAQTGSVLVTSRASGGRALSILPPHHVVLATRDQLVGDLGDAFALLRRKDPDGDASLISFITGPSRTGDIERILVLGAHGPKRLTILLVE